MKINIENKALIALPINRIYILFLKFTRLLKKRMSLFKYPERRFYYIEEQRKAEIAQQARQPGTFWPM